MAPVSLEVVQEAISDLRVAVGVVKQRVDDIEVTKGQTYAAVEKLRDTMSLQHGELGKKLDGLTARFATKAEVDDVKKDCDTLRNRMWQFAVAIIGLLFAQWTGLLAKLQFPIG